jgi:YfiH family protein
LFYTSKQTENAQQPLGLELAFKQLASKIVLENELLIFARQTHSANISIINKEPTTLPIENADGLISNRKNMWLCVQTADCTPVLLYDKEKQVIAAIHAGWRGIAQNICGKAVEQMRLNYAVKPAQIYAYVGPCISQQVYEVGQDVFDSFVAQNLDVDAIFIAKIKQGKYFCNIKEANKQLLERAGLKVEHIAIDDNCTYKQVDKFYSARRDGNETGRIISGIILR